MELGKFKEITGRAEVQVRDLYERSISMTPHFTPFLIFNSVPDTSKKVDQAVRRRLEVIGFESEFVNEPKLPHQIPIDVHLSDAFPCWKVHLFNILYHDFYKKHVLTNRPIPLPAKCKEAADSILDNGQVVRKWFEERVVQDPGGFFTLNGAKHDFYGWVDASGHRCDGVRFSDLKKHLRALMNGDPIEQMCNSMTNNVKVNKVWKGFKLKENLTNT